MSQQMERERLAAEQVEKEKAEKAKKLKESFGDATGQWEKDKSDLQNIALEEQKKETAAAAAAEKKKKEEEKEMPARQAVVGKTEEKVVAKDDTREGEQAKL